jgi:cytochrome c
MRSSYLFLGLLALMCGLWYFTCRSEQNKQTNASRPNDPWVFRSVLDKKPRMLTFALNDRLWVAYSTDSCTIYKAWAGGADFSGAVYNMRHGPQPVSVGAAWFENKRPQAWRVTRNGKTEFPSTDYKGHRYTSDGHAELMYDLVLADGQRIRINERPEYVERDRQPGFERTYEVQNCPEGAQVALATNVASIAHASNVRAEGGTWSVEISQSMPAYGDIIPLAMDGTLALQSNGITQLTTMFVSAPQIANPFTNADEDSSEGEATAAISPGERLINKSDCRTCHNEQVKTVGPAYVDIAERYKNIPANVERLTKKIINGGSGVWGIAAMSAHATLSNDDARTMLAYILALDEGEDDGEGGGGEQKKVDLAGIPDGEWLKSDPAVGDRDVANGLMVQVFQLQKNISALADINFGATPDMVVTAGEVNASGDDFGPLKNNFALAIAGFLYMDKDDNVLLQLSSDDGSRLILDNRELINHDGPHGMEPKEAEVALRAGYHPIRIEYFQGGGGQGISLKWARSGDSDMKVIPMSSFYRKRQDGESVAAMGGGTSSYPGDRQRLTDVHPSYTVTQARPETFLPKVGGMDFLPDGRLLVSTWDAMGGLYVLDNVSSGDPKKITVKQIARGLAEPLGVKVVDGQIYVLQKQELTHLVDTDGDDIIDEYRCFAKGWRASANFHEFAFGLVYQPSEDAFYAALATAINPGGASTRPQILDRGKVVKISRKDGSIEFVARGLRTPDGVGMGPDNQIFIADNQGDWLPASKILHVKPGAFYNSYSVDSAAVAGLPVQQPVVWLPQDEIGNSPTQPILLNEGPYKDQLLHGDVYYGGLQRVFMEKVNGDYQGCVFRFTQGLEGGTHRIVRGPDNAYYIGMIGNPGNWGQDDKLWYGLQRMQYNGTSTFEMLAIRAKSNGVEIEFTEPLRENNGWETTDYEVEQWYYKPTAEYGGPKLDLKTMPVASASVSSDRKKVFLEIPGLKSGHVVHVRLANLPISDLGHEIWTTEGWYTLNAIPQGDVGTVLSRPRFAPATDNTLTEAEKAAGWQLLFDGQGTTGWHNWGKTTVGKSWIINDNAIHLDAKPNPEGHWQAPDGGDIITAEEYENYELSLDWKIGACGNSGIIYNIVEDPSKYEYVWQTGPEMQVLDNACHPDSKFPKHRAGDLYDMIACKHETVKPAGQWNHVRIIIKNGKVEHWLNDRCVVRFTMFDESWRKLIAGSKFNEMPGFGKARKGRIALQDHGDPVWYKNIKIRKL